MGHPGAARRGVGELDTGSWRRFEELHPRATAAQHGCRPRRPATTTEDSGYRDGRRGLCGALSGLRTTDLTPGPTAHRLLALATPRADGVVVALERIGIADVARVANDLETGHQLDIARRTAGCRHADALGLVGGGILGPVLLQRVLRRGLVGEQASLLRPSTMAPRPAASQLDPTWSRGGLPTRAGAFALRLRWRKGR